MHYNATFQLFFIGNMMKSLICKSSWYCRLLEETTQHYEEESARMIQSASPTRYLQRLKECLDKEEELTVSEHNGLNLRIITINY